MGERKKICCAIDISGPSRLALENAADLAKQLRAELVLLHVNEAGMMTWGEAGISPAQVVAQTAGDVLRQIARWAEQVVGQPFPTRMLSGKAAEEILRFVREESPDLLAMGTHGRTGLMHFIMGSVAEKVVRHADCPVLVARSSAGRICEPWSLSMKP